MRTTIATTVEQRSKLNHAWIAAACLSLTLPAVAQSVNSGVARPEPAKFAASADADAPAEATATTHAVAPAPAETVYGAYVPYRAAGTATTVNPSTPEPVAASIDQIASPELHRKIVADPDAGIVTYIPSLPGEIPDGSLLKVKLREDISTATTKPGSAFTAEVTEALVRDGRVVVPAGAVLAGRVTWVRSGRRLGGLAAIHLEPQTVTLPDGSQYMLRARVIDTSNWARMKVDSEGTITQRDQKKETLAALGLATGGGMAAGAIVAGVPGALVGAGIGAGAGTVVWLRQDRQADLPKDFGLVFSLTAPMIVSPATASAAPIGAATGANGGS